MLSEQVIKRHRMAVRCFSLDTFLDCVTLYTPLPWTICNFKTCKWNPSTCSFKQRKQNLDRCMGSWSKHEVKKTFFVKICENQLKCHDFWNYVTFLGVKMWKMWKMIIFMWKYMFSGFFKKKIMSSSIGCWETGIFVNM